MFLFRIIQLASFFTITEIEYKAYGEPGKEPEPVGPAQTVDHGATYNDTQDRNEGTSGVLN